MYRRRKVKPGKAKSSKKSLIIPYSREKSNVFEEILRPRLNIALYSKVLSQWITVDDVMADTGADLSLLPKNLGTLLVGDIRGGKRYKMTGLIAGSPRYFYLHSIKVKLGLKKFDAVFAIAVGDDVPPTLGRIGALDRVNIEYNKGQRLVITW